ncbi:MAG: ATP-binding cassette domain-containing protein [Rhizobiaceae bacterium]
MLTVKLEGTIGTFSITADIEAGVGVTAIYGPSGAGKSTILRAISGLWQPEKGFIQVGENVLLDTHGEINLPTEKRRLGVVFQEPILFPHLSVHDNLAFGMKKHETGWDGVIEMLDLGDLVDRMPRNLSGGESQRVALGRAILSDPQVLLLDEPLTGLDDSRRAHVLPYLERLRDETTIPIVYVSHHRDEILQLADLIFTIDEGTVTQELTPGEFKKATLQTAVRRQDDARE